MPHVLLVDDYPDVRATLQDALEGLSACRVTCASTSNGALALLDGDRPDLLVLDALMPGMPGIDLAADAARRGIPVILMTGDQRLSEDLTVSGWRHLRKPFRLDTLLAEVHAVLVEAERNVEMVRASLQRLRATQGAHHQAHDRLREARLQSETARQRRRDRETPPLGPRSKNHGPSPRVMVVEDDAVFARSIEAHLARAGFEIEVAVDCLDALTRLDGRTFDMLVLDVAMPAGKPNGLTLARMIRYRNAQAPIIFVTGYPELAAAAASLPGKVFVKPVDLDALVAEIRSEVA